jgi:hypothetical protein
MALSYLQFLQPTDLAVSATAYYTSSNSLRSIIRYARVRNHTASAQTVTIYKVPSGGSVVDKNLVLYQFGLSAKGTVGDTYLLPELLNMQLEAGDAIYALASNASSVSFELSGMTSTQ